MNQYKQLRVAGTLTMVGVIAWYFGVHPSFSDTLTPPSTLRPSGSVEKTPPDLNLSTNPMFETFWAQAEPLSLTETLQFAIKTAPEILLAQEKIHETEIKQRDIKSKRLLLFFKYFNAGLLEGAAESDVMAAVAAAKASSQKWMLDLSKHYTQWARAWVQYAMATNAAQNWDKQIFRMQRQFEAGQVSSVEVKQAEAKQPLLEKSTAQAHLILSVQQLPFELIENQRQQHQASPLNQARPLYRPGELAKNKDGQVFSFSLPFNLPGSLTEKEAIEEALSHREELKEIKFRHISIENLLKARFDKTQEKILISNLKQLDLRHQAILNSIQLKTQEAYTNWTNTQNWLTLHQEALETLKKAQEQAIKAQSLGWLSQMELWSVCQELVQAEQAEAMAKIDVIDAELQLLYEMGRLTEQTLKQKTLEL
jgi:outer membrane protein TolC